MDEFDGVLDGEDMVLALLVGQIEDGSQGRGLAAARGARHQDQALREPRQAPDGVLKAKLVGVGDLVGDHATDQSGTHAVLEIVHPQAAIAGFEGIGEVGVILFQETGPGVGRRQGLHHLPDLVGAQDAEIGEFHHVPVDPGDGDFEGTAVDIGALLVQEGLEQALGKGLIPHGGLEHLTGGGNWNRGRWGGRLEGAPSVFVQRNGWRHVWDGSGSRYSSRFPSDGWAALPGRAVPAWWGGPAWTAGAPSGHPGAASTAAGWVPGTGSAPPLMRHGRGACPIGP